MGSLARHRAANRFQIALQQRLGAASDQKEVQQVYDDALVAFIKIVLDDVELDRVSMELATDPDAIEFPE